MTFSLVERLKHKKKSEAGFSFLELVIVVAVIGILTAIAIPSYGGIQTAAKQAAVDSAAQNGLKAIAAQQASDSQGGSSDVLAPLRNDTIELGLYDSSGNQVSESAEDYCVRAHNKVDLNSNETPKFVGFAGDCDATREKSAGAQPGTGSGPGTGTETDPGAQPGTGGETTYANARFQLRCDVETPWEPLIEDFNGEQLWTDAGQPGPTIEGIGSRTLEAGVNYTVELDGSYSGFIDPNEITSDPDNPFNGTPEQMEEIRALEAKMTIQSPCFRSVDSWGSESGVESLAYALIATSNIGFVAEPPTTVKNYSSLFYGSTFNQNINHWDVSNAENMYGMFLRSSFNQPLDQWDVSNVTNMFGMFGITNFNQNISNWNVNKVVEWAAFRQGAPLEDAHTPARFID